MFNAVVVICQFVCCYRVVVVFKFIAVVNILLSSF